MLNIGIFRVGHLADWSTELPAIADGGEGGIGAGRLVETEQEHGEGDSDGEIPPPELQDRIER